MNDESDGKLRPLLIGQEKLLWSGRPRQGVVLRRSDAFLIPVSLVVGGIGIYWGALGIAMNQLLILKLMSLMPIGISLMLIFGRFLVDARLRAHTYYGLTSARVLIVSGFFRRSVTSLNLDALPKILLLDEREDGFGTIDVRITSSLSTGVGCKQPASGPVWATDV